MQTTLLTLTLFSSLEGNPPFREIDILGIITSPLPPGVTIIPGPYGNGGIPAFKLEPFANVGRFAQYFFARTIKPSFSLVTTIRPTSQRGGYIFSIMKFPRHSQLVLGLKISSDSIKTFITLEYLDETNAFHVFRFTVPQLTGTWRRVGVAMSPRSVTLYVDCKKMGTKVLNKDALDIKMPPACGMYVGRAGWRIGEKPFMVSNIRYLFFMTGIVL